MRAAAVGEGFEALEGKRKVHAPLVVGDGVNFVDDHGFDIAQDGAALFGSEQDVERFGVVTECAADA